MEQDLRERVRLVIERALKMKLLEVDPGLGDPPGWDSLLHMEIVVAIEDEFSVRFPTHTIADATHLSRIVEIVQALKGARS
jgi:acyl carrier protein